MEVLKLHQLGFAGIQALEHSALGVLVAQPLGEQLAAQIVRAQRPVSAEDDGRRDAGSLKLVEELNELVLGVDGVHIEVRAKHFGDEALVVHQREALIAARDAVDGVGAFLLNVVPAGDDVAHPLGVAIVEVVHIVAVVEDLTDVQHGDGRRGAGGIQRQPGCQLIVADGIILNLDVRMLLHELAQQRNGRRVNAGLRGIEGDGDRLGNCNCQRQHQRQRDQERDKLFEHRYSPFLIDIRITCRFFWIEYITPCSRMSTD